MEDQPAVDKPGEKAPQEGETRSFKQFVDGLVASAYSLFPTADVVRAIFTAADREFVSEKARDRRVSRCCTHIDDYDGVLECWALGQQKGWTRLFGPRGIELVEVDAGTLRFRTLNVNPEDLLAADDAKFLCLCLWLLEQHRCISSVSISVPVVAPRHGLLFLSMLKLTMYVTKLEIMGDNPFKEMSVGDLPDSSTSREPWMHVLKDLCNLRELGLSSMYICETDALVLIDFLERRKASIVAVVLIDVEFSAATFYSLIGAVHKIQRLEDLRIKTSASIHTRTFENALSLLGKSSTLSRLYVHVDFSIRSLLNCLTLSGALAELTLEPMIRSSEDLESLRLSLERRELPLRLKMSLDLSEMHTAHRSMNALLWIVRRSCVRTLILSGSTINLAQSGALAEALESSKLEELHLDECGIECEAVERFASAIAEFLQHSNFKELNVGAVVGDAKQQRQMFRCITEAGVRSKITLVCTECLIQNYHDWDILPNQTHFAKVSLSIGDSSQVERILLNLMAAADTLESFSIKSNGGLSEMGGNCVAELIRTCTKLKVLRLRCRLTSPAAVLILAALAKCRNVRLLTVEGWVIDGVMGQAFETMLTANRSLFRLEFYWKDFAAYQGFKPFLTQGLRENRYAVCRN
ncbi:uncharacterized protein LOC119403247 [Rhipicephalus sanguineus]|uniref:uncharacterized protein LOC119403247 n=1 Tax=Rhipicephalus sanguineus TaxID=34632 RepID=UPI0020C24E1B|nr:uncharacterized protein LOC119403247 [Rhipicephalus sanguineus]